MFYKILLILIFSLGAKANITISAYDLSEDTNLTSGSITSNQLKRIKYTVISSQEDIDVCEFTNTVDVSLVKNENLNKIYIVDVLANKDESVINPEINCITAGPVFYSNNNLVTLSVNNNSLWNTLDEYINSMLSALSLNNKEQLYNFQKEKLQNQENINSKVLNSKFKSLLLQYNFKKKQICESNSGIFSYEKSNGSISLVNNSLDVLTLDINQQKDIIDYEIKDSDNIRADILNAKFSILNHWLDNIGDNNFCNTTQVTSNQFYLAGNNCGVNCYSEINYIDSPNVWNLDGTGALATNDMDIYLSSNPNGRVMVYFHPMGENKAINQSYEIGIKDAALSEGYHFITVEFRHPILEENYVSLPEEQEDIIDALKYIRKYYNHLGMNSPDDLYIMGFSKGSLALANLLQEGDSLYDNFGRIKVKAMYLREPQVTYNYDLYYNNLDVNMSNNDFNNLNNAVYSLAGFKLTTNTDVIDAYNTVLNQNKMISQIEYLFPIKMDFKYAYQAGYINNTNLFFSSEEVIDYTMHNPEGESLFCGQYSLYQIDGVCSAIFNSGNTIYTNEIFNFFNSY